MSELHLPFIQLPEEFLSLLKSNLSGQITPAQVFDSIRPNQALYSLLENSFKDLDDGRGLEKTMLAQGWQNFRNRIASIYISKTIYGHFPLKTDPALVEDIVNFENDFFHQGVQSNSRLFMLGFYFKLAQLHLQKKENNRFMELDIPRESILSVLRLTQGRAVKTDLLILIVLHFLKSLGDKMLTEALVHGKSFNEIHDRLSPHQKRLMHTNLLSYSASIREPESFLYEKI